MSIKVLLQGYAIGLVLALVFTVLAMATRLGNDLLETLTAMFNPLPAIALLPLALIWFGLGSPSIIFVLVHAVHVADRAQHALRVPGAYRAPCAWSGATTACRACRFVGQILIPAAFPSILAGLKIGWAFAWRTLIAAELVFGTTSGSGGLGWFIYENKNLLDIPAVFSRTLHGDHHRTAGRESDLPQHRSTHHPQVGDAFLSLHAASRFAPVSALLLGIVWIAEIGLIFRHVPLLDFLGSVCLAAYIIMALARASVHIRTLFLLVLGVSLAIAWSLGATAGLAAGFAKSQIFGAFLPSVLMLRATVEASPRIERLRADLGRLGHEAAQNWTQVGSHALGAVLNVGATAILAPVVARGADPSRLPDLARSSARGVGGAVMWSPFFLALAFTSQLVPQAPLWQSMSVGAGLALIGLALSYRMFTPSLGWAGFRDSVAQLAPLVMPMLLVIGAVVGATLLFRLSGLQSVAIVIPLLCLGYIVTLGPLKGRSVLARTFTNFGRLSDELLIVVGATVLGAAVASLPVVRELGASMTPDADLGPRAARSSCGGPARPGTGGVAPDDRLEHRDSGDRLGRIRGLQRRDRRGRRLRVGAQRQCFDLDAARVRGRQHVRRRATADVFTAHRAVHRVARDGRLALPRSRQCRPDPFRLPLAPSTYRPAHRSRHD